MPYHNNIRRQPGDFPHGTSDPDGARHWSVPVRIQLEKRRCSFVQNMMTSSRASADPRLVLHASADLQIVWKETPVAAVHALPMPNIFADFLADADPDDDSMDGSMQAYNVLYPYCSQYSGVDPCNRRGALFQNKTTTGDKWSARSFAREAKRLKLLDATANFIFLSQEDDSADTDADFGQQLLDKDITIFVTDCDAVVELVGHDTSTTDIYVRSMQAVSHPSNDPAIREHLRRGYRGPTGVLRLCSDKTTAAEVYEDIRAQLVDIAEGNLELIDSGEVEVAPGLLQRTMSTNYQKTETDFWGRWFADVLTARCAGYIRTVFTRMSPLNKANFHITTTGGQTYDVFFSLMAERRARLAWAPPT